jgi:predicted nucleotidyltransferase
MTAPAIYLSSERVAQYRAYAQQRQELRAPKIKLRLESGWELARKAARILREKYQVKRVVVFGSLLREKCFTEWSDIDIAAWGIPPEQTFRAIGALMDLDSSIEINLVDINICPADLLKSIEEDGVDV